MLGSSLGELSGRRFHSHCGRLGGGASGGCCPHSSHGALGWPHPQSGRTSSQTTSPSTPSALRTRMRTLRKDRKDRVSQSAGDPGLGVREWTTSLGYTGALGQARGQLWRSS